MEPMFSLGVVMTLGGVAGVLICLIVLLSCLLHSSIGRERELRAGRADDWMAKINRHQNGRKAYFEYEGQKVYALVDDLYVDQRDAPIVRSYSLAPQQVWEDGVLVLQMDQVIPDDVASNAAASVSPSPYGNFIP